MAGYLAAAYAAVIVVTVVPAARQLGITIGALYGSAALVVAGPLLVPAAAALPVIAALVIAYAGKTAAYPPGPRESVWKRPRPVEEREDSR